ncbi:hypothetical protein [Photobacterium nomapromontoriensis]|uniref:hypothetical protein n=1 Tax=Photobacterium nomapromontoriensis TaxID=2910237 RepID=UPI003D0F10BE
MKVWSKTCWIMAGLMLLMGCNDASEGESVTESKSQKQVTKPIGQASGSKVAPVALPSSVDIWQSPEEITLAGVTLYLGSELWLNSMPVIGDDGTQPAMKLFAAVRVLTRDIKPLPKGVEVTQVLLEQDKQQWLVQQDLEVRANDDKSLELALRGGPEWLSGSKVDVAVTVLYQGKEQTLVQKAVLISQVF